MYIFYTAHSNMNLIFVAFFILVANVCLCFYKICSNF